MTILKGQPRSNTPQKSTCRTSSIELLNFYYNTYCACLFIPKNKMPSEKTQLQKKIRPGLKPNRSNPPPCRKYKTTSESALYLIKEMEIHNRKSISRVDSRQGGQGGRPCLHEKYK